MARSFEQFKKLRVVLGPVEITNPADPAQSTAVSLGDIPISTKYFIQWLTKKMLERDEVHYTLSNFLNAFLNELVREFLGNDDCFNGLLRQSPRLSQAAITSYKVGNGFDEITTAINRRRDVRLGLTSRPPEASANEIPLLNVSGPRNDARSIPEEGNDVGGLGQEINYLVYYAGRVMPAESAYGNKAADEATGVFHYGIGRDKGIVKTINFRKADAAGLKELRFEQQGYDGLQQLREQYDVEIKTFSNVTAYPGLYIYVDPLSIAPNSIVGGKVDLTQMGVGGYHMIIRSEHSFGPGLAESTITAKWVAEKYSANSKLKPYPSSGRPQKCPG